MTREWGMKTGGAASAHEFSAKILIFRRKIGFGLLGGQR
jgi:hypothetical protein